MKFDADLSGAINSLRRNHKDRGVLKPRDSAWINKEATKRTNPILEITPSFIKNHLGDLRKLLFSKIQYVQDAAVAVE